MRVKTLQEVVDASTYFFKDFTEYDAKGVAKQFKKETIPVLQACLDGLKADNEFSLASTEKIYNAIAEKMGLGLGKIIQPSRLALTGRTVSPGMFDVIVLLGKEKTLQRLQQAIAYIEKM
ncbi:MAG: hypothetical protein MJ032_04135 [Acidaminococcaceae bacterium]|nr:hypothetical protein [Acidaminococcaceae bacterium]